MSENIFETASREKFRFSSGLGELTVEQLWDLPLKKAGTRNDLDSVARIINDAIKANTEESFVDVKPVRTLDILNTKMSIVKHIINVKQEENKARVEALEKKARKEQLLEALAAKDENDLKSMSREQIQAELAKL